MGSRIFKFPLIGRVGIATDRFGSAVRGVGIDAGGDFFETNLTATVIRNGRPLEVQEVMSLNPLDKLRFGRKTAIDLGSGLVTNVGVLSLANVFNLANPAAGAINTLKLANYHASGTGTTAAAATDIMLQTADAVTPLAGTQALLSAPNVQKYQTVATLSYSATEAVTEWGLFLNSVLSAATGSITNATISNLFTNTFAGSGLTSCRGDDRRDRPYHRGLCRRAGL